MTDYCPMLTPPILLFSLKVLYNVATLCLSGTLSCVDFMDVTMGNVSFSYCFLV